MRTSNLILLIVALAASRVASLPIDGDAKIATPAVAAKEDVTTVEPETRTDAPEDRSDDDVTTEAAQLKEEPEVVDHPVAVEKKEEPAIVGIEDEKVEAVAEQKEEPVAVEQDQVPVALVKQDQPQAAAV